MVIAYESLLATSAVITTIVQYLSGAVICRKYIQKKSTGDSSGFPFLCGFLSCSFWLRYGSLTNEQSVFLTNLIGALLFLFYTLIFYTLTVNKKSYVKQFAVILVILVSALFYTTNLVQDREKMIRVTGLICCVVTVFFFAAPLTMLGHVIRVKNSESLPLPLIVTSFLVSLQWLIYGILISDSFLQIPNFLGCMLSLMQLCLFVFYPPKSYRLLDQTALPF